MKNDLGKICSRCKTYKEFRHFNKLKKSSDGHQNYCKKCVAEHQRERRHKHVDKVCESCKQNKTKLEFYQNRLTEDGLHPECKECCVTHKPRKAEKVGHYVEYISSKNMYSASTGRKGSTS